MAKSSTKKTAPRAKSPAKSAPAKKAPAKPKKPAPVAKKAISKPKSKPTPAPIKVAKAPPKPAPKPIPAKAPPKVVAKVSAKAAPKPPINATFITAKPIKNSSSQKSSSKTPPTPLKAPPKPLLPYTPPPLIAAGEIILSNGKPKKNQAGLNSKELEHFRDLLLAKRRELVGDMSSMEREALRSTSGSNLSNLPMHMADMGTDNYEQEFTLGLVQKDRDILREINTALAKIQNGSFGICEGTGKPIGKPRLEAKPWARHGIEFARNLESRGIR